MFDNKELNQNIKEKNNKKVKKSDYKKLNEIYLRHQIFEILMDDDPVRGIYSMYGAHHEDVRRK